MKFWDVVKLYGVTNAGTEVKTDIRDKKFQVEIQINFITNCDINLNILDAMSVFPSMHTWMNSVFHHIRGSTCLVNLLLQPGHPREARTTW